MSWHGLVLIAFVLAAVLQPVASHGYMSRPKSRNYVKHLEGGEYCPHCYQSGGPAAVKSRGQGIWPTTNDYGSHGLCGDPGQGQQEKPLEQEVYMLYTTAPQESWTAGEVVDIQITITTHHKGHFEFRICDKKLDASSVGSHKLGQECLNQHLLMREPPDVAYSNCVPNDSRADCQPIDPEHPERWYLPPPGDSGVQVAYKNFSDDDAVDIHAEGVIYTMKYRIPRGLSCTECTLQWQWSSANSCLPDGSYLTYFKAMQKARWNASEWCPWCTSGWATCENSCCPKDEAFGEEFWNCADVTVNAGSGSTVAPTMPASTILPTAAPTTLAPTTASPVVPTPTPNPGLCRAAVGNDCGITDEKCAAACAILGGGVWPCDDSGLCECKNTCKAVPNNAYGVSDATCEITCSRLQPGMWPCQEGSVLCECPSIE